MNDHLIGCGCDECHRGDMERLQAASLGVGLVFMPAGSQINDGLYEQRHKDHLAGHNVAPIALTEGHVSALERAIRAEGYDIQIDTETGEVRLIQTGTVFDRLNKLARDEMEPLPFNWVETGYSFEYGNFYRDPPGAAIDGDIDSGRIAEQLNRFDGGDAATRADAGAKLRSLGMFRHPATGESF